jgi:hypothetical protein
MYFSYVKTTVFILVALFVVSIFGSVAEASHSWGNYHWARTANPFTLKLGDNVTSAWDAYLGVASTDWSVSSVLDTTVVPGLTTAKLCKPTKGRVEVCNSAYGKNGWLGIAQIWISGDHITQGVTKMNDTYFKTATYNTPAWKQMVVCQEIGHTFGLDHQDEDFNNANLGTCMDYTNDPSRNDGIGNNTHPNAHDYEQLETIYAHLDSFTTVINTIVGGGTGKNNNREDVIGSANADWGQPVRTNAQGRGILYKKDIGNGEEVFTFVVWADQKHTRAE